MCAGKHVILVRTCHDETTEHTYGWSEEIRRLFEEGGWTITDCECEDAVREQVEAALEQAPPESVFVFYGHGYVDNLEGRDGMPVCDLENAHLLGKCKVYTVACSSIMELGEAVAKRHGAPVYFGYADAIQAYWIKREKYVRETTEMMAVLGNCVNSGLRAWLAQPERTALEIRKIMKTAYEEGIDYCDKHFLEREDFDNNVAFQFLSRLRHNEEALTCLDDKNNECLTRLVS
uniref:Caspase domain-containing protein n=1 Tax=Candidatus Kentrum sp. DK TaxID=2126562 RepID=A0A450SCU5_9GAMM|nr:MAG: hypothetical protein BECKDK2373B_GA0170837_102726 [Candidatus Kentron sp. DK]